MRRNLISGLTKSARRAISAAKKHASKESGPETVVQRQLHQTQKQLLETQVELQKTHVEFSLYQHACRFEKILKTDDYVRGNPLVSIIIINRNGLENCRILMQSLAEKKYYENIELICVDNGSDDGSPEYLESYGEQFPITVVRNGENKSFSEANNIGIRHASGDYFLFLNNDISVTDYWLDALLHAAQTEEHAGAVGARLIYPESRDPKKRKKSYAIQHAGIVFSDVLREDVHFIQPFNRWNGQLDRTHGASNEHLAAVTAAVMLVSREAYLDVGGFDEGYEYGYEDVDLCLKLTKAGYRNIYCPDSILFHYEFGTQGKDDSDAVYRRRLRNFIRFRERWNDWLAQKLWEDKMQHRHIFTEDPLKITVLQPESTSALAQPSFEESDPDDIGKVAPVLEFCSYSQYADKADQDMKTDILIDPKGSWKHISHRKSFRFVLCCREDIPADWDAGLIQVVSKLLLP